MRGEQYAVRLVQLRPLTGSSDLRCRNSVASTRSAAWSEAPSRRAGAQRCSACCHGYSAIG